MRLVVMNHLKQMQDVKGFLQQTRLQKVDTILALSTDQTSQSGVPDMLTNVTVANDGISRLYQDNPMLRLQKTLQTADNQWRLGWATQTLHTTSQQGVGVLTKGAIGVIWQRMISPHIQIQVMDMDEYVFGMILVNDVRLVRQHMLQRVHDLLKAQVKPVLLFGPRVFSTDLEHWGWTPKSKVMQQIPGKSGYQEIWCDCAHEVALVQQCILTEGQTGILIDFQS